MKYYFNKQENCFYQEDQLTEITPDLIEYSQEEYNTLWNCDALHYVDMDPETGLPQQCLVDEEEQLKYYRRIREKECFPYINRGKLWYDTLTNKQKEQLEQWYDAWLNVTDTKTIPEKPNWLK